MGRSLDLVKSLAFRWLPRPALTFIRTRHYYNVFSASTSAEELDRAVAVELVDPGQTVVDVGANIGVYTHDLSRAVGPTGRVISLEPVPETFHYLTYNVRRAGLTNVVPLQIAASDRTADVVMHIPRKKTGVEFLYRARIDPPSAPSDNSEWSSQVRDVTTKARRLDDVLAKQGPVSFMKCDVEGHELECIAGAMQMIRRDTPAMLIEVSGRLSDPASKAYKLTQMLSPMYSVWERVDKCVKRIKQEPFDCNVFFLNAVHEKRLRNAGWIQDDEA